LCALFVEHLRQVQAHEARASHKHGLRRYLDLLPFGKMQRSKRSATPDAFAFALEMPDEVPQTAP